MIGGLYKAVSEEYSWTNFDKLRVTDSTLNEGTNSLVTSKSRGGKDGFVMHCRTMSAMKLAMAGTKESWHQFIPLSG